MQLNTRMVHQYITKRYSDASSDDIDDAVSYSFITVWKATEAGVVIRCPEAFAITVAKRAITAQIRWREKYVHPDDDSRYDWPIESSRFFGYELPDPTTRMDAEQILREAPATYATVLRKHYLEGQSFNDIATSDGITPACVRKRHERALKWARKHFAEQRSDGSEAEEQRAVDE